MVRGGGTGSRNKKKKAAGTEAPPATHNGVENKAPATADNNVVDKHKNTKHNRKQKEDSPPIIQHQEDDQVGQKESGGGRQLVPTSEQLRLAQITQSDDNNKDPQRKAKIQQIMEITGKSEDDVATALFDCDWDETKAIELLLDQESSGFGSWEDAGKKKTKKSDKDEKENEDLNDEFDPSQSDNRERSRNRGPGQAPRLRNRGGSSNHAGGRGGDSDWKHRENENNERNFEGGRGRGRGMGPRGRGGHIGSGGPPRGERRGGRGGPRGGGHRPDFDSRGGQSSEGLGQIDTWNPIGAEKEQNQRMRNNKDAFDNAGNWGDDFPAAEDWDNDEYTGSLADSKVFTPSGSSSAKAVGEPVNGSAPGGHPAAGGQPTAAAPAANNSLSYSQPIDLSSLLKTGGLREYNAAASQDLKSAIGIGGGGPGVPGAQKPGAPVHGDQNYAGGSSLSYSSAPGSAFSPIKPAAVTNGAGAGGKQIPRARLPPPSRIPSSAVEMPGAGDSLSKLDVQFGGMDLQFGGSTGSANDSNNSNMEFNAAPGQGLPSSTTPSKDSSYAHSIQSVSGGKGGDDSTGYKSSPSSIIAPGQPVKPDTAVNQSLSSALSAAGIKTSATTDTVPGYNSGSSGSRSSDKYGGSSTQRSPGPALISKPDYVSQYSGYGGSSSGGQNKSSYNSYSGSSQPGYDRQNSSGYSGSNGLNSSYGGGSGGSSSYAAGGQSGSSYAGSSSNNFSSSYGAATTAGGGYSSFSSNNSYSGKSGVGNSQNSNSYLPAASTVGSSLSQYSNSTAETSTAGSSSSKVAYGDTATVSAASGSSSGGLGLSSVTSSSKMSVGGSNASSGNKLVPGMPPGVGVLPAQYMTPAGFPAYLAAGLGQPAAAAAMYGYGGHQLEDLAALQRSTLAASLPQLPSTGYYDPTSQFGGAGAGGGVPTTLGGAGGRQDGQNSFGDSSKYGAGSDSTSSPVPSSVGNTVGQPTPFNLASTFTAAAAAQHPTLPPGYAYFYGGVGGMPGLQYGGGVAGGGVYPGTHPGIPVPTAAGPTSTSQFQNKAAYGSSYGTSYDSLSLGQSNSGYAVNNKYGSDTNQGKAGGSSNNTAGTGYWSNLW